MTGYDWLGQVLLLLILLDPLGNISLFLSLLKHLPPQRRRLVIIRENVIALGALLFFAFFGDKLLKLFRLSESALEISGGLVLFLIALRMVFPPVESNESNALALPHSRKEPLIVPLAIPLIVGPASLATVILTAQSNAGPLLPVAILIAIAVNTILLLLGEFLAYLFGKPGLEALERLMGLVLTAVAVQMLISGLRTAFTIT